MGRTGVKPDCGVRPDQHVDQLGVVQQRVSTVYHVPRLLERRYKARFLVGHDDRYDTAVKAGTVDADLGAIEVLLDQYAVLKDLRRLRQGDVTGVAVALDK